MAIIPNSHVADANRVVVSPQTKANHKVYQSNRGMADCERVENN